VGVALGWCEGYQPLRRTGAKVGDLIISIGRGGRFWRDALAVLGGQNVDKYNSPLFRPTSQIGVMSVLAKSGFVNAAMDNSDGLLPTLSELSKQNGLGIEVSTASLTVDGVAQDDAVGSARMWLGWGDWNVIACISPDALSPASQIAEEDGFCVVPIGRCLDLPGPVYLRSGDRRIEAPRLESERFAKDSWMSTGIEGYVNLLKGVDLP
jgi:thiamine-monophosphate kinase